jgi:hypothetical protein
MKFSTHAPSEFSKEIPVLRKILRNFPGGWLLLNSMIAHASLAEGFFEADSGGNAERRCRAFELSPFLICTLLLLLAPAGFSQTKDVYGLVKGQNFIQVTDTFSLPHPELPAYWQAWARHTSVIPEPSVIIRTPLATEVELEPGLGGAETFRPFTAIADCDLSFPAGSYTIRDQLSPSNSRELALTLPAGEYPPAPQLVNMTQMILQSKQPLPIRWKPLEGATAADRIIVFLEDLIENTVIYRSPLPGEAGALSGTSSQFTLPPLNLTNQFVFLAVSFIRVNTAGSIETAEATGTVGLASTTRAFLFLLPDLPEEPDVQEFRLLDGVVTLQSDGSPSESKEYVFETAVIAPPSTKLTGISVQSPPGTTYNLEHAWFTEFWLKQLVFGNESELRAAAPNGIYNWTFELDDKPSVTAELTGSFTGSWPALPIIRDLDQLQTGEFSGPLAIRWQPIPGANAADMIEVTIVHSAGGIGWRSPKGFRLSVLSTADPAAIPEEGASIVYVLKDSDSLLHFRVFDESGEIILDENEERFDPEEVAPVRDELEGVWGQAQLSSERKETILNAVLLLLGFNPEEFPLALDGTSTHLTIPAGVILAGNPYEGRVRLLRILSRDQTALDDAVGLVGRFAETRFPLASLSSRPLEALVEELPPAEIGEYYQGFLNAAGGRRPYSWSLVAGELPRGLEFESKGRISGIPAGTGTFTLGFAVQDSTGQEAHVTLSLSATGTVPPLTFVDESLPPLIPGMAYFAEFALSGGVEPYSASLVSGRLPEGLDLEDCCGFIAGKPLEAGDFTFELQLEDGAGQTQRRSFSLHVPAEALEPPLRFRSIQSFGPNGIRLALSGAEGDPITIESSDDLVTWNVLFEATLPPERMLSLPIGGERRFMRARLGFHPPTPNPLLVTPILSDVLSVSGELTVSGLTLKLTNDLGIIITLEIPEDAVLQPVQVTMTAVDRLEDSPLDEILWGVELKPEGLNLFYPGSLTARFPGVPPTGAVPFAYAARGRDCRMHAAFLNGTEVMLPIHHFSGYGQGQGDQASEKMQQHKSCEPMYAGAQAVAELLHKYLPDIPPQGELEAVIKNWYNQSAYPNLRAAEQNDTLLKSALREFLVWAHYCQLLGLEDGFNEWNMGSVERGILNAINRAQARCSSNYDPEEAYNILEWARQGQLLGLGESSLNMEQIGDRIIRCYRFELKLDSIIREVSDRFVEQVVSGPAYFEWNWSTLKLTSATEGPLERRYWYLKSDRPTRPEGTTGRLIPGYLRITVKEQEQPPVDPSDPCKPPPEASEPKTDIVCTFAVEDPVTGFWAQGDDGNWHFSPLQGDMGGRWYAPFKAAHYEEFGKVPAGSHPDGGLMLRDGFEISDKWEYLGGRLYAKADYVQRFLLGGQWFVETTVIELWHAPKPFRRYP